MEYNYTVRIIGSCTLVKCFGICFTNKLNIQVKFCTISSIDITFIKYTLANDSHVCNFSS